MDGTSAVSTDDIPRDAAAVPAPTVTDDERHRLTAQIGALNLCSKTPRPVDQESEDIGSGVAAYDSLALANAQKQGQLYEAVASRDLIGQAKGIHLERDKISGHEAFLLLTKVSAKTNTNLREVAEGFVRTGVLPSTITD